MITLAAARERTHDTLRRGGCLILVQAHIIKALNNLGEWRWSSPVLIERFIFCWRKEKQGFDFFVTTCSAVTTAGHRCVDPGESHAPRTHTQANKSGIGVGIPATTTTTTKTIAAAFILRKKGRACIWTAQGSLTRQYSGVSACASAEFLFYCCSCRKRSTHARRKATHVSMPMERKSEDRDGMRARESERTVIKKWTQQITHDRALA